MFIPGGSECGGFSIVMLVPMDDRWCQGFIFNWPKGSKLREETCIAGTTFFFLLVAFCSQFRSFFWKILPYSWNEMLINQGIKPTFHHRSWTAHFKSRCLSCPTTQATDSSPQVEDTGRQIHFLPPIFSRSGQKWEMSKFRARPVLGTQWVFWASHATRDLIPTSPVTRAPSVCCHHCAKDRRDPWSEGLLGIWGEWRGTPRSRRWAKHF